MEVEVKEWGNSLGIILPSELAKKENIKSGDKVKVMIIPENNGLRDIFGILKDSKIDSQKMKDEFLKGWG